MTGTRNITLDSRPGANEVKTDNKVWTNPGEMFT